MTPRPFDAYLRYKITAHLTNVLVDYIDNPDDVECAVEDIIEAIENEMIWLRYLIVHEHPVLDLNRPAPASR
jgi:hypothetical protein